MISREEFDEYKKTLFSGNDKSTYAQKVKNAKIVRYILWGIDALILVLCLAINLRTRMTSAQEVAVIVVPIFCVVAFVIITVVTIAYGQSALYRIVKAKIPGLLQYMIGEQLNKFEFDGCVSQWDFKNSGFAGSYDDYAGEDFIDIDIPKDNGARSGVSFQACDLHVTKEEKDDEGNKRDVTVYSGAFCAVNFPFDFKCRLAINSSPGGVKKIKLEDVAFNRTFQVFTNDKVEALCILTPGMMQKLTKLHARTRNVKVSILDSHMYLGFPSINLFRIGKPKSGTLDESVFDKIYDDVALLLAIVDEIKRNNKVFKM